MSILMAALKQQNQPAAVAPDSSRFWRKLALVLALLLALLTGAIAAYLMLPRLQPAEQLTAVKPVTGPADPEVILQALEMQPASKMAAVPPAAIETALSQVVSPTPAPVTEQFKSLPAVKTMTAGTAAAEPQPATPRPAASQPAASQPTVTSEQAVQTEVSAELRDKFASALKATEQGTSKPTQNQNSAPATDINNLDLQLQQQIPSLRFEAHVYATTATQRWVKVNGKTLQEGQWVTADIRIKEITPQYVLLQLGEQLFSMPALSSWPD